MPNRDDDEITQEELDDGSAYAEQMGQIDREMQERRNPSSPSSGSSGCLIFFAAIISS